MPASRLGPAGTGRSGLEAEAVGSRLGPSGTATSTLSPVERLKSELGAVQTPDGLLVILPGDVLFDFDNWDIRDDARPVLARLAELISKSNPKSVAIEGHTDAKGSDEYNQNLSEKRAASVKAFLVENHGLDGELLETSGRGESAPVAPNANPDGTDNPEGRQRNRRVEFVLK